MEPFLKSLTLTNFRSYSGTHRVAQFPLGLISVEGRNHDEGFISNAAGKSSLLHAISWSLYGALSTGTPKDALVSRGAAEVSTELECRDLVIKRSKRTGSPEKMTFWTPGSGWVDLDLRDTQARLELYLRLPRRIFFASSWIDREAGAMQLLLATPSDRLKIMQEVFSEDRYKTLAKDAKTYRGARDQALLKHQQEIGSSRAKREELVQIMQSVEQRLYSEQRKSAEEHQAQVAALRAKYEAERAKLERLNQEETNLRRNYPQIGRANSTQIELSRTDAEIRQLEAFLVGKTPGEEGFCPTCKQKLTKDAAHSVLEQRQEAAGRIERLRGRRTELSRVVTEATETERRLTQLAVDKAPYAAVVANLQQELTTLARTAPGTDTLQVLQDQIVSYRERIVQAEVAETVMQIQTGFFAEAVEIAAEWERAFSPKGIPNLLLDRLRSSLQVYTRDYLYRMCGGKYAVSFPVSDNGFDISVRTAVGVTELGAFSRGERWRINLALIAAFRQSLQQMYPSRLGFVVLDDCKDALDDAGNTRLYELARMLAKEVPHVFIAAPQALTEMEDGPRIVVEKRADCSKIVEVRLG